MKTLDEVIKALEICTKPDIERLCRDCAYGGDDCGLDELQTDALHFLKELKSYVMGEKSRSAAFGKRLNNNVAVLPEGIYCNVCGTRLDLEEDDDDDDDRLTDKEKQYMTERDAVIEQIMELRRRARDENA